MIAMVLAAGIGSRLAPITDTTPKCLVDVGGVPMIAHVFTRLKSIGIRSVVVNVHHHAEKVIAYLSSAPHGMSVTISREDTLLDTGGGIKRARPHLEGHDAILIHNADVASEIDLNALISPVTRSEVAATLSVIRRESSRGLLFDQEMQLVGKRKMDELTLARACELPEAMPFSGISCLSRKLLPLMDNWPDAFGLPDFLLDCVTKGHRIRGIDGGSAFWLDMGTPERLETLRARFQK